MVMAMHACMEVYVMCGKFLVCDVTTASAVSHRCVFTTFVTFTFSLAPSLCQHVHNNKSREKATQTPKMALRRLALRALKTPQQLQARTLTHYPVDDSVSGISDEQKQLRETVFNFCQKELAPHADAIDKANNFPEMRDFWKKLGDMGLLGITANPDFGGSGMGYLDHCIVMEEMSR